MHLRDSIGEQIITLVTQIQPINRFAEDKWTLAMENYHKYTFGKEVVQDQL